MELTGDVTRYSFSDIPVDSFWNVGSEDEHKMHRIHSYPAKFPAFITTKAIQYSQSMGNEVRTIADVFCGCGTTAYEARRNSIDFWGCDINPVATLIAEVKSKRYKDETLNEYFQKIITEFNEISISDDEVLEVNDRIKYWFYDEQSKDLLRLKKSIYTIVPSRSHYRKFFLCAFSNILKRTSKWLSKSIKPQTDSHKKPMDVQKAFNEQFKFMRLANLESDFIGRSKVKIENINFLDRSFRQPFVDLLITSPPYVTSYEYADLHQLSTLWLDYTDDYKSLREGTIGSRYHHSDFLKDVKQLNKAAERIVFQLYNYDKRRARAAARYYLDIQTSILKCYDILHDGGMALFVIGNTEYKGVKIENAKHLVESMEAVGFSDIQIRRRMISNKNLTPYRDEIGRFTRNKDDRRIYAEEFIITGRKNG